MVVPRLRASTFTSPLGFIASTPAEKAMEVISTAKVKLDEVPKTYRGAIRRLLNETSPE